MNRNLPLSLKRKELSHCVVAVLTYGAETWRLSKHLESKLRRPQWRMESKMLVLRGETRSEHYAWIRKQTKTEIHSSDDQKKRNGLEQVMSYAETITGGQPK